jgi:uroporphyrin-III C-methyltransferase/precorrin-2 dehydrogenase/sirohydrochlorin ferrochelatase
MRMTTAAPTPPRDETAAGDPGYFPLFLDLRDKPVLVVGGNSEAAAKAEALCRAGARVTVVAAEVSIAIAARASCGDLVWHRRAFRPADLDGMRLAIVATEDDALAREAVLAARHRGVLVNAVDRPALSDAIMPAVVERGPLRIAISTGGLAPALARDLRARIEAAVPAGYGRLARFCGAWRSRVAARLATRDERQRFWTAVLRGAEARAVLADDETTAGRLIAARLGACPARTPPVDHELSSG